MRWPLVWRQQADAGASAGSSATARHDPLREFARLSQALLRTTAEVLQGEVDAQTVVRRYCEALAGASEHLPLAWSWFGPSDIAEIRPQVCAGSARAWGEQLQIPRNWLTAQGPAFSALAGRTSAPFTISRLALWGPWREAARRHHIRSVLCLPLQGGSAAQGGVFVVYADRRDYFDAATVEFFSSVAELFASILARAAAHQALRRAALTDALTGLGNRHVLDAMAREAGERQPQQAPTTLALVDLDWFKQVNDVHGHDIGDQVLRQVAATLRGSVRQIDDVLRLGGEEFLVCLRGAALAQGVDIAQLLCSSLRQLRHPLPGGRELQVSASIGVAGVAVGETLDQAIKRADIALYCAKRSGRDRVCVAAAEATAAAAAGAADPAQAVAVDAAIDAAWAARGAPSAFTPLSAAVPS
ncbi:MAG: GGDEF domain-containing protein [Leptothrix sp. (in: b-proteobacteria)]